MRIAALYDIHGNLPALEAVLQDVRAAGVDRILIGGDVVPGPMPRETMELLLQLDTPVSFIRGNGDRAVLEALAGMDPASVPEAYRPLIRWNAERLDAAHEQIMAAWPATLEVEHPALGTILFCHATPRSDSEIFTRRTDEARLLPVFADVPASLVVCGHTHMQFDRAIGSLRVVNAGSVGMPFGEPGAYWLLLGSDAELRHTAYDAVRAAELVRATDYPQAEEFAAQHVLHCPAEEEMLARFAQVEIS